MTQEHERYVHSSDSTKWYMCSDVHYDSVKCDRDLFHKQMKKAEKEGRTVFINGDLYDFMQGKYDPRGGKGDLRPEYQKANYIDDVINQTVEDLLKYDVEYFIGVGNHCSNILKRLETDVIARTVHMINAKGGKAWYLAYEGYIILKTKASNSYVIKYHHGSGSSGRSKNVLSNDIDVSQNPDADMIVKGHTHDKWYHPHSVRTISVKNGVVYTKEISILRTGSFKKRSNGFGWEIEKDFKEPTLGGWFVDFTVQSLRRDEKARVNALVAHVSDR